MDNVTLQMGSNLPEAAVLELYQSVGWSVYTRHPEQLLQALRNSSFVVSAWLNQTLVGLARTVSDQVSICYIQDILVRPEFQGQGIGQRLMQEVLQHHKKVRQIVLITENEPKQLAFYTACGFKNLSDLGLNGFYTSKVQP